MRYKVTFSVVKEKIVEAESENRARELMEYNWEDADVKGNPEILNLEILEVNKT